MATNIGQSVKKMGKILTLTALYLYFVTVIIINLVPFLGGPLDLLDFGSFYASGLSLRNGQNPYGTESKYVLDIDFPRVGAGGKMINLNPPIAAMAFGLIAKFDPHQSFKIWQITSAVLFTSIIILLTAVYKAHVTPTVFFWSFTLAGFWQTLILGQIYILLLIFVVLGWIFLRKQQYVLAGIVIGCLVAVKPNFILWPLFLLIAGYPVLFLISALSAVLISLIPLVFFGVEIYQQWWNASALQLGTLILPGNSSLVGLTSRFKEISIGIAMSVILVGTLLYLLRRRSPISAGHIDQVSALGILAAVLASPISWVGYTLFLLPLFFSRNKWVFPAIVSAAVLTFPFIFVLKLWQNSFSNFVIFGWFYGWGLIVLLGLVIYDFRTTSNTQTNGSMIKNEAPIEIYKKAVNGEDT